MGLNIDKHKKSIFMDEEDQKWVVWWDAIRLKIQQEQMQAEELLWMQDKDFEWDSIRFNELLAGWFDYNNMGHWMRAKWKKEYAFQKQIYNGLMEDDKFGANNDALFKKPMAGDYTFYKPVNQSGSVWKSITHLLPRTLDKLIDPDDNPVLKMNLSIVDPKSSQWKQDSWDRLETSFVPPSWNLHHLQ